MNGEFGPNFSHTPSYGPLMCQLVVPNELATPYREDTVPNLQRIVSLAGALLGAGVSVGELLRRLTLQEDL